MDGLVRGVINGTVSGTMHAIVEGDVHLNLITGTTEEVSEDAE